MELLEKYIKDAILPHEHTNFSLSLDLFKALDGFSLQVNDLIELCDKYDLEFEYWSKRSIILRKIQTYQKEV